MMDAFERAKMWAPKFAAIEKKEVDGMGINSPDPKDNFEVKGNPGEVQDGWHCLECGEYFPDDGNDVDVALYECGNCGARFNRNNSADGDSSRCPDCGKFSGKVAARSCPMCEEGEVEECEVYEPKPGTDQWEKYEESAPPTLRGNDVAAGGDSDLFEV